MRPSSLNVTNFNYDRVFNLDFSTPFFANADHITITFAPYVSYDRTFNEFWGFKNFEFSATGPGP